MKKPIKFKPGDYKTWYNKGIAMKNTGKWAEAIRADAHAADW